MATGAKATYSQFGCIGSGFSAIALGATLQRWYGITDVRFFERHSELGGTWFANQYPGCACDVPSVLYSFSFARNPRWTEILASADELREYLNKVAADYDLPSKMSFRHQVERCEWLESKGRWRMQVRDLDAGSVIYHECQFLFSGTGILVTPRKCDVPGAETFAGPIFHSAQWRHDVDLSGKNVVLIGNGCTASQIVPAIVNKTKHLTQFVRSKHWYIPPINVPHTETWQWLFEHVPGVLLTFRALIFLAAEETMRGMYDTADGARHRGRAERRAISYVKKTAPKKYHDMLIPDFPMGCKRRIHDPGYCAALHADNISVTEEPLVEILPHAVRARDGSVTDADVIVLANGFETNEYMHGLEVVGRGGKTVNEHWKTFGGPEAYVCSALSDFPNFFMILGPNTTTGHTSTVLAIENSINFALRVIKPVLDREAKFAVVKRAAEERYSRDMQAALRKTVWNTGCRSWYVREDDDGEKWNAMTYPHYQGVFWYETLFPKYKDWVYPPTQNASSLRLKRRLWTLVRWIGVLLVAVGGVHFARRYQGLISNVVPLTKLAILQVRQKYNI